jgi:protein O-mannosyl-transferase
MAASSSKTSAKSVRGSGRTSVSFRDSVWRWFGAHPGLSFALLSGLWVLALYWRALGAPFIYDDLDQIVNNPALGSLHATFHRFWLAPVAFTSEFRGAGGGSTYRPLYWLSLAIDRKVWGAGGAGGFHFTNLLIHWANGVVGFMLLRRVRVPAVTAAVAAIVWLGMPINTEVVDWVSGRAYLLCGFFLLLGLWAADSYLRSGKWLALAGYFVASLTAVFSHEAGLLVLPLTVLVAYAAGLVSQRLWSGVVGAAVLVGVVYFALKHFVGAAGAQGAGAFWAIGLTFWKYVLWMIAPVHMSVERSTSAPANVFSAAAVVAWVGLLALIGVVVVLRKRVPIVAAGLAWMVIALLPFCGFVFIYQGMAERFCYLAAAGLAVVIASFALEYAGNWKKVALGCCAVWVVWGAWRVNARVVDWSDPVALYQSSLEATPQSPTLFYNLGFAYREKGYLAKAEENYREATRLWPEYQRAWASLGDIDSRLGRPADAVAAYKKALTLDAKDAGTTINLAMAYEQLGDNRSAEEQLQRAIALAPKESGALTDLGALYQQEGRIDDAIKAFQTAIENNPSDPIPYFDMAVMFQQRGQDDVALRFYKKVLQLRPDDPDTLVNLGKLHPAR